MARHNETGRKGEHLARIWLAKRGYQILEANWRHAHEEIDLVARLGDTLHFIEVKTRRSDRYGYPEEAVSRKKIRHLIQAAEAYLLDHPDWKRIQFDILAISLPPGRRAEYLLLEDVYL